MRLPDAVGIGFRRCASSWLHACLNQHPSVGKTPGGIHYFSDHLEEGDDWYMQQVSVYADKEVIVDFSISYGYPEHISEVVQHMHRLLPHAKVFAIVRDPVQRAFSDYRRSVFKEEFPPSTSFERALIQQPALLERGRYGTILPFVLSVFPRTSVAIWFYDDVVSRPVWFWGEVCGFLEISPGFVPSILSSPRGHLGHPKHPNLHRFLRAVNRGVTAIAQGLGLGRTLESLKRTELWQGLVTMSVKDSAGISPSTRRKLTDFYAEDISFLERLTNRDLSGWRR